MTIWCSDIEEALSAYADGQELPHETPMVRAHLEACEACRALLAQWELLTVPSSEPVGEMAERVMQRVRWLRPRRGWAARAGMFAAALLAVSATGSVLSGLTLSGGGDGGGTNQGGGAGRRNAAVAAASESASPSPGPTSSVTPTGSASAQASPAGRSRPPVARGFDGELALVLTLDRLDATPGQRVTADFVLRNRTRRDVMFTGATESPFDLVIRKGGNVVYRRSAGWSGGQTQRTLRPGEQITEQFTFDAPAAGGYLIHAECACARRTPPGRVRSPSPSPTVAASPTGTASPTLTASPAATGAAETARRPSSRPTDQPQGGPPSGRPRQGRLATGELRFVVHAA